MTSVWAFLRKPNLGAAIALVLLMQFVVFPTTRVFGTSLHWELVLLAILVLACLWLMRVVLSANALAGGAIPSIVGAFVIIAAISSQAMHIVSAAVPYTEAPYRAADVSGISFTGSTVSIDGEITLRMFSALEAHLANSVRPSLMELRSPGGSVFAARGLARLVRESGADTIATGRCYSSCALVFISGSRRTISDAGELGFHGYAGPGPSSAGRIAVSDVASEEARDKDYYAQRGIAPQFIERAFATPHADIWVPSLAELRAAGVLNR